MKTFSQRMPEDLHSQAVLASRLNGDGSLNAFVNAAVTERIAALKKDKKFRAKLRSAMKQIEEF